jgi:hypothetical protein
VEKRFEIHHANKGSGTSRIVAPPEVQTDGPDVAEASVSQSDVLAEVAQVFALVGLILEVEATQAVSPLVPES